MSRLKMGNPKKKSRFICLRCGCINNVGDGIQRSSQREFGHIKDLMCLSPECNGAITKNIEVRYCDDINDIYSMVAHFHEIFYEKKIV